MRIQITKNDMKLMAEKVIYNLTEGRDEAFKQARLSLSLGDNMEDGSVHIMGIGNTYNDWKLSDLKEKKGEILSLLNNKQFNEITKDDVIKLFQAGVFNAWFPSQNIHQTSWPQNGKKLNNRGEALEYLLGRNAKDNISSSDLIDAELKAYDIKASEVELFSLTPKKMKYISGDEEKYVDSAQLKTILSNVNNKISFKKNDHRISDVDYTNYTSSKTYAKVKLNKDGKLNNSFSIFTDYYGKDEKVYGTLVAEYSVAETQRKLAGIKTEDGINKLAKVITGKLSNILYFSTLTLDITNGIKPLNVFAFSNCRIYQINDADKLLLNFINSISDDNIIIRYTINDNGLPDAHFRIRNNPESWKSLYTNDDNINIENETTNLGIGTLEIDAITNSEEYKKQKYNTKLLYDSPLKNDKIIEKSIQNFLDNTDITDYDKAIDEWWKNFLSSTDNNITFAQKDNYGNFNNLKLQMRRKRSSKINNMFRKIWEEKMNKHLNEHKNMRIQITENDIRLMVEAVVTRINSDSTNDSDFYMADNDDDELMSVDDEKFKANVEAETNRLVKTIKNFIDSYMKNEPKINVWMDKKGIEPKRREKVLIKCLQNNGIVIPVICKYDLNNLNFKKGWGETYNLSPIRLGETIGIKQGIAQGKNLLDNPEEMRNFVQGQLESSLKSNNQAITDRNIYKRQQIQLVKDVIPELFDGSIKHLPYKTLYDKLDQLDSYKLSQNKYAQQAYRKVRNIMRSIEDYLPLDSLGTMNGWEKDGKEYQKYKEIAQMKKQGNAISFSSGRNCWNYYTYIILNDNGEPTEKVTFDVDSSD